MALRYYICPVTGTGSSPDDPLRPSISDTLRPLLQPGWGCSWHIMPDKSWALAVCDIDDATHVIINALPQVFSVPKNRNLTLDQLTAPQLTAVQNKLSEIGVSYIPGEAVRALLRRIGLRIRPNFLLEHDAPNQDPALQGEAP